LYFHGFGNLGNRTTGAYRMMPVGEVDSLDVCQLCQGYNLLRLSFSVSHLDKEVGTACQEGGSFAERLDHLASLGQ
jgi:hypothetical protein